MPKLTVEGVGEFEVPEGKRLVLALEDEAKIDQLHACGGNARCTTCRVEFLAGEPEKMTLAEKEVLAARGLSGVRLSCQILCDHDMSVRAISRLAGSGRKDAGQRPADRGRTAGSRRPPRNPRPRNRPPPLRFAGADSSCRRPLAARRVRPHAGAAGRNGQHRLDRAAAPSPADRSCRWPGACTRGGGRAVIAEALAARWC